MESSRRSSPGNSLPVREACQCGGTSNGSFWMVGLTDLDKVKRTPLCEFFFPRTSYQQTAGLNT